MYIYEAASEALKTNGKMYRKLEPINAEGISIIIKPTNSYESCILLVCSDGEIKGSCRHWNPSAEDLMADDWSVLGDELRNELITP